MLFRYVALWDQTRWVVGLTDRAFYQSGRSIQEALNLIQDLRVEHLESLNSGAAQARFALDGHEVGISSAPSDPSRHARYVGWVEVAESRGIPVTGTVGSNRTGFAPSPQLSSEEIEWVRRQVLHSRVAAIARESGMGPVQVPLEDVRRRVEAEAARLNPRSHASRRHDAEREQDARLLAEMAQMGHDKPTVVEMFGGRKPITPKLLPPDRTALDWLLEDDDA